MPNLNAALACAQLEQLGSFIEKKRELAHKYHRLLKSQNIDFVHEQKNAFSNYWLNSVVLKDKSERDEFLKLTHENGVMTRPIWILMNRLNMFQKCPKSDLSNAEWLEDRVVNITSSVRL